MSDEHTLKSFEIRHLECCFIRTEGVKWKFIWKKMSCFVLHRLVCTPDHWLPIYIKYTYKPTSPAVPLIKLCTPTNRARIHPRGAFFLNLSIILFQFNNMQGPLTQYLTKATQMMRLCGSPNQQRKRRKCHYKKGVHFKKGDRRFLFSTLLESCKVKTSKSIQQPRKCLGWYTSNHWNSSEAISSRQDVCP